MSGFFLLVNHTMCYMNRVLLLACKKYNNIEYGGGYERLSKLLESKC